MFQLKIAQISTTKTETCAPRKDLSAMVLLHPSCMHWTKFSEMDPSKQYNISFIRATVLQECFIFSLERLANLGGFSLYLRGRKERLGLSLIGKVENLILSTPYNAGEKR
jgi:hypothetical protein